MKLFQIPIYAFDKNTLKQRILKWKMNNYPTNPAFADNIHYMQKNYEYNHIVGYIELGILSNDIYGHLYLPYIPIRTSTTINGQYLEPKDFKKRYIWNTKRKIFLERYDVNGSYVYMGKINNSEIIENLLYVFHLMQDVVNDHNKNFYIDDEAFQNTVGFVDYVGLYKNCFGDYI